MDTAILIITGVVSGAAAILICLLLKMIVTGDYSLLLDETKLTEASDAKPVHIYQPKNAAVLSLADVAHFVKDTAEFKDENERTKAAQDLRGIRMHHHLK